MGRPERLAVQRRLAETSASLVERISTAIRDQIPTYAALDEDQRRETEAIAGWGVQRLLEQWVRDTSLDKADLRRFYGIGVARGTDGRPLFAVLRAYRVGAVETSRMIHELADGGLTLEDARALGDVLLAGLDQLSESLFAGYTAATERMTEDRALVVCRLADDLVTGRQASAAALRDRSDQLGIRLPTSLRLTVLGPTTGEGVSSGDVAAVEAIAPRPHPDDVLLTTLRQRQGVFLHSAPLDLADIAAGRGRRVCTFDETPLADLPAAYRAASAAVRHAPAHATGPGRTLHRADALFVALLRGEPAVEPAAFAAAALEEVLDPSRHHLLEGLTAYLHAGNAAGAGKDLGLHPQSMRYRLRRVREVTGRDVGAPWDRHLLHTATTIHAMAAASSSAGAPHVTP